MKLSSCKEYQIVNGTYYNILTNKEVIRIMEICRENNTRIVLDYGDTETGRSWGETNDITGTIGRSGSGVKGCIRVPILVHNKRSLGGGAILDSCIVGIKTSIGKAPLYQWSK